MPRKKRESVRTCVGCRGKHSPERMIRIVRSPEGRALLDLDARLPGRGAWVCPDEACLKRLKASSLSHVLKADTDLPDLPELRSDLNEKLERKGRALLSIGMKAGQVAPGAQAASEALRRSRVELLIFASDASSRTVDSLTAAGSRVPALRLADRSRLGRWLGKRDLAVVAVTGSGLARRLRAALESLTALGHSSYHLENKVSTEED